ncbi:MAG TPA: MFS transporter [Steroidobacteraceae bacterium]|nr:MFS transporter [Steroidobacteraceae bacterium]
MPHSKPLLSFWQIWNMCFGFLGLQFGFALQNANVSRIFQTLGAGLEQVPLLWIAAPFSGLLVQPLVGYCSDRTWTRLGRRRPYFLAGALLAATALILMPRSPTLWVAAALLWLLDGAINVSMEPFRAFVGDQLNPSQRPAGYSMQSFFIGLGAVVASMLPWLLAHAGVSNRAMAGADGAGIPDTVRYAFEIGAVVLLGAILWTILRSREYPPEELLAFDDASPAGATVAVDPGRERRRGLAWALAALAAIALIRLASLDRQLYLVCGGALVWGLAQYLHGHGVRAGGLTTFMRDLATMPQAMRRLAPVQFFSWLALFSMWIYTTAAVAQVHFGSTDPHSEAFNRGANWVGVLFAAYNGFAALAAAVIPFMVRRWGLRLSHLVNVWLGAAALLSFALIRDPNWLLLSMVGMGFAWASILSLPYALLSDSVPAHKMGLYMGVFNFFIVIPQLVAATVLGFLLHTLFGGAPIYALLLGGASFLVAGLLVLRVPQPGATATGVSFGPA